MKIKVSNQVGEFVVKELTAESIVYYRQGDSGITSKMPRNYEGHGWHVVQEYSDVVYTPPQEPYVTKKDAVEDTSDVADDNKEEVLVDETSDTTSVESKEESDMKSDE
jgi:hypothetical protein